jgi:hypothetical protein
VAGQLGEKMTFDRTITVLSMAVAVIASLAASVQGYVSWRDRNDALTSAVFAEVAKGCHDIALEARNTIGKNVPDNKKAQLLDDAMSLDILVNAIGPDNHNEITSEVQKFISEEIQAPDSPPNALFDVDIHFVVSLNAKCTEIIRKKL